MRQIPGIQDYPDLQTQLTIELSRVGHSSCGDCEYAKVYAKYREKVKRRKERDSQLRRQ